MQSQERIDRAAAIVADAMNRASSNRYVAAYILAYQIMELEDDRASCDACVEAQRLYPRTP